MSWKVKKKTTIYEVNAVEDDPYEVIDQDMPNYTYRSYNNQHVLNESTEEDEDEEDDFSSDEDDDDDSSDDSDGTDDNNNREEVKYFWTQDDDGRPVPRMVEPERGEMYSSVQFLFPKRYSKKCGVMLYLSDEGIKKLELIDDFLAPFAELKLSHELSKIQFITLFYDSSKVKTTKLLPVVVRYYDSGYQTRLLDLKLIEGDCSEEDIFKGLSEVIRKTNLAKKIISIIGDNEMVTTQLTIEFELDDLVEFPSNLTDIMCDILDHSIKKSLTIDLFDMVKLMLVHFSNPRNVKQAEKYWDRESKIPFDGKFDSSPFKWQWSGMQPIYRSSDCFLALIDSVLYKIEKYWTDLQKYFTHDRGDSSVEFIMLKYYFNHATIYAWFHLFYKTDFVKTYGRAIQRMQYHGIDNEKNIVSRVTELNDLNKYFERNTDRLYDRCSYVLSSVRNLESVGRFESDCNSLIYYLREGFLRRFGKLLYQFEPLEWMAMGEEICEKKVLKSLSVLPEPIQEKIDKDKLVEEVKLVLEYQYSRVLFTKEKPYKKLITRLEKWNLPHTKKHVHQRWIELFAAHPDQLSNMSLIVDYIFSLPIGYDSAVMEIYEDVDDFWEQETKRFPANPDVSTVKAAIRMRHNDIVETKRDIETVLKDPLTLESVIANRKAALAAAVAHSTSHHDGLNKHKNGKESKDKKKTKEKKKKKGGKGKGKKGKGKGKKKK